MATQEDILKALTQLDSGNDEHWTDDGLPRVDIVQQLTKDPDVRRKHINEASPGFSRAVPGQTTEPEDVQPGDPIVAPVSVASVDENEDTDFLEPTNEIEEDDLKAIMQKRVSDASERLTKARAALSDAQAYVRKCEEWELKAKQNLARRFPPLHPSDAIKQHLEAQQRLRYERAGFAASQIDQAMGTRGKRGWGQTARRV